MKTALIHEWLVTHAGAESVLQSMYSLYPGTLYSLFHNPAGLTQTPWEGMNVVTSMLQNIPFGQKHYRTLLPLFPMAIEQFDLREYNLILSSSYAVAKGILSSSDQLHICYCHTPMRYIWDLTFQYLEVSNLQKGFKSFFTRFIFHYIRMWDATSAKRVNAFIANSHYIARRIKKCYNRKAKVIYPPVDVDRFHISERKDSYFIIVSRLVPYKRIDLVVHTFNNLKIPLVIIGEGPAQKGLKEIAHKNIHFLGHQPPHKIEEYLSRARAFVFSAEEDFGIVNVEAQAAGVPVIAYGRGGALETVIENKTGLFFYSQDIPSITAAIKEFIAKEDRFNPTIIRKNAERFPRSRFDKEFKSFVDKEWEKFPYKK